MESYYEVRESPNKGLGAFATTDIPRGTRLTLEEPLLMAKRGQVGRSLTQTTWEAYAAMSLSKGEAYDQLYYAPRLYDIYVAEVQKSVRGASDDIMECMARVAATRASNSYGDGVYELGSRFNHSCTPNCNQSDTGDGKMAIYSVRDVKAGEELTASYTDIDQPQEARQKHLDHYGFVCDCSACDLATEEGRRSEERRTEIWRLRQDLTFLQGKSGMDDNKLSGPLTKFVSNARGDPDPSTAITTLESLYKSENLVGTAMIDWLAYASIPTICVFCVLMISFRYYVGFFYHIYRPMGFYEPDNPNDDKEQGIAWARKAIEVS